MSEAKVVGEVRVPVAPRAAPVPRASSLNVGCGGDYREGWVNLDRDPTGSLRVDVRHDILRAPWPFQAGAFSHALLSHVLEHVPHTVPWDDRDGFLLVMEELHRVLRPGGTVEVRVPHPRSEDVWRDPTHTRVVEARQFAYFEPGNPLAFYSRARFWTRQVWTTRRLRRGRYHVEKYLGAANVLDRIGSPAELVVVLERAEGGA